MKVKIKRKKCKVKIKNKKLVQPVYLPGAFDRFKKELETSSNINYFISKTYMDLFENTPPVDIHRVLVITKIEYEYAYRDLQSLNKKPTESFMNHYKSAMVFDMGGFGSTLKTILLNKIKEDCMTKSKKKVAEKKAEKTAKKNGTSAFRKCVGKELKMGIQETWAHLFSKNETQETKMSDKEISDFIKAEFPDRKTAAFNHVPFVRGRYNRGLLTKGVVPSTASVCYVPIPGTKAAKRADKETTKLEKKSTSGKLKEQVSKSKEKKVADKKVAKAKIKVRVERK